ncbi:hypothetical protein T440DRAFT_437505 [Plenodomus tracheiphilus IPT5]|uniref:Uncharacterized protein n=1 Tax=Plenodomus tracheiphilus IPT5 TaxID=1408161 RepID=A0A6A7BMU3_9PLEO|nr:hypothetical protein T440DRAFT_437505 [Plenodomus tracheiphilus IPT5]
MPIDRPNQNNPRPLKPTLASNRTAKTPLTPRLAVAPTASSTVSSQSTRTLRSTNGTTPRAPAATQDSVTPVKAFLNSNITPRSSSRKSRVGVEISSPNESPNGTPSNSRPTSSIDTYKDQGTGHHGLTVGANNGAQNGARPRSVPGQHALNTTPSPRLQPGNGYNHSSSDGPGRDTSSLFFHANDAKPSAPEPQPSQKKAPVFFYANGKQDDAPRKQAVSSPPLPSLGRPQAESKFFHADSLVEPKDRPPIPPPPPTTASPELLPPHNLAPSPRASSPTKEWSHLSYRKGASQVIRPALVTRNSALSNLSGSGTSDLPDRVRRRSSVASTIVRQGHHKSASLSSIESVTELRKPPNETSVMTPSPLHTENRQFSNVSIPDSVASAPSPLPTPLSGLPSPTPLSPTRGPDGQSALEHMNELAANARRERKVLDLEISNSSLLAINRSLEKEVRKQKAELRRLRRMSRAGLPSLDIVGSSLETFSATAGHAVDLSDMSEEEAEPEEPDESSDSSLDESTLDTAAQAEREEAQRIRDEKRLQLDLSKHRDLLLDSQKMNQSLKKCLGWTEQLIKDGQKALDYKVHVSDVNLGGRVLIHEDDHDAPQTKESRGLLSPWSPLHTTIDALDSPFFPQVDHYVDRDSGVDLDGHAPSEADQDGARATTPPNDSSSPVPEFRPRVPGRWESYATIAPNDREKNQTLQPIADVTPLGSPFEERIRHLHASIDALEAS